MNVYVNANGYYYMAASPQSPGDSLVVNPSPAMIACITANGFGPTSQDAIQAWIGSQLTGNGVPGPYNTPNGGGE